jgi:chromosome segregation ATPase
MKRSGKIISAVLVLLAVLSAAGCDEQNKPDKEAQVKKHQLIAAENMQLKNELEQARAEIASQKELLDKCAEEKKASEEQMQKTIDEMANDALKDFEELVGLREQVEQLKQQLEELKPQGQQQM